MPQHFADLLNGRLRWELVRFSASVKDDLQDAVWRNRACIPAHLILVLDVDPLLLLIRKDTLPANCPRPKWVLAWSWERLLIGHMAFSSRRVGGWWFHPRR